MGRPGKEQYHDIELGERLKRWRQLNRLTPDELAHRLGVSVYLVVALERGQRGPLTFGVPASQEDHR